VGGFVGSEAMLKLWIDPMVKKWGAGIETLVRIAVMFPQNAYAGLVLSLQAKWQYICHVVPGVGQFLEPVESALCEKFITALLQVSEPVDNVFCQLLSHGVKMGGISIKNPVTSAPHFHQCLMDAFDILVMALHDGGGLNAKAHKAVVKLAGNAACKAWLKVEEENLEGLKGIGKRELAKCLGQIATPRCTPNCPGTQRLTS
jgi:hypothetical protein